MQLYDRIHQLIGDVLADLAGTPAQRQAAQQEIEVTVAPNDFGGWSIYPHNAAARALFAGTGPAGNFPSAPEAEDRARRCNCWTVVRRAGPRSAPISLPAPAGMQTQQAPGARGGALSAATL